MEIILFEPEIPPNTGTIARACAATKTRLNLIEPLGFSLEDKYLKRAGLDYWPHVDLKIWKNFEQFAKNLPDPSRIIATSARKGTSYHQFTFEKNDYIMLGPETRGLPEKIIDMANSLIRIPIWGEVRSINLSNAASILLYECLRQTGELDGR